MVAQEKPWQQRPGEVVGRVVPGLAPRPAAMLGKEPEEAQAMPAEALLQADPEKGHGTDPCLTGQPRVLVPRS